MSNYGKIKKDSIVSDFCTENKQAVRFDGKKFYESQNRTAQVDEKLIICQNHLFVVILTIIRSVHIANSTILQIQEQRKRGTSFFQRNSTQFMNHIFQHSTQVWAEDIIIPHFKGTNKHSTMESKSFKRNSTIFCNKNKQKLSKLLFIPVYIDQNITYIPDT